MSKTTNILLTVVLALVLGFAGGFLAQQMDQDETQDVSGLRNKVNSLQATLGDVQNKVENVESGGEGPDLSGLRNDVESLQNEVSGLKSNVENIESGGSQQAGLEVGYMNAQRAFEVFTNAVGEQRKQVKKIQSDLKDLMQKFSNKEIKQDEFRKRYDTLRAKRLQAQLEVDLAMVKKMQEAKGFTSIREDLQQVERQTTPIKQKIGKLVENLEMGLVNSQKAESSLNQLNNQFKQLDNMTTGVIESKMSQVAYGLAKKKGYDLVFRQKNVLLYRNTDSVNDLTEQVKEQLREEIKVETG